MTRILIGLAALAALIAAPALAAPLEQLPPDNDSQMQIVGSPHQAGDYRLPLTDRGVPAALMGPVRIAPRAGTPSEYQLPLTDRGVPMARTHDVQVTPRAAAPSDYQLPLTDRGVPMARPGGTAATGSTR